MNVFFLERRTAPSSTFTRTGPRSGSARRGCATLLVKKNGATFCFCGSFAIFAEQWGYNWGLQSPERDNYTSLRGDVCCRGHLSSVYL